MNGLFDTAKNSVSSGFIPLAIRTGSGIVILPCFRTVWMNVLISSITDDGTRMYLKVVDRMFVFLDRCYYTFGWLLLHHVIECLLSIINYNRSPAIVSHV